MARRLSDREYEALLAKPDVQEAMKLRCDETSQHDYENCMTALFQVYQQCKWCGARR